MIEVFKAGFPNRRLLADQAQINAHPHQLIRWTEREAWLKSQKKQPPKAPSGTGTPVESDPPAESQGDDEAPPTPTREELIAEAERRGIPVTARMSIKQLEKALAPQA